MPRAREQKQNSLERKVAPVRVMLNEQALEKLLPWQTSAQHEYALPF